MCSADWASWAPGVLPFASACRVSIAALAVAVAAQTPPNGFAGVGGGTGLGGDEPSILAQVAVVAAEPIMLAACWRLTALYIAMPSVSAMTASSMPAACPGA